MTSSLTMAALESARADGILTENVNSFQSPNIPMRRGKWTVEEEDYANRLIHEFKEGLLPLTEGTTLRTFLSKVLNCDPMRISKKFVGANSIGKQIFRKKRYASNTVDQHIAKVHDELAALEKKFLERVTQTKGRARTVRGTTTGGSTTSSGRSATHRHYGNDYDYGDNAGDDDDELAQSNTRSRNTRYRQSTRNGGSDSRRSYNTNNESQGMQDYRNYHQQAGMWAHQQSGPDPNHHLSHSAVQHPYQYSGSMGNTGMVYGSQMTGVTLQPVTSLEMLCMDSHEYGQYQTFAQMQQPNPYSSGMKTNNINSRFPWSSGSQGGSGSPLQNNRSQSMDSNNQQQQPSSLAHATSFQNLVEAAEALDTQHQNNHGSSSSNNDDDRRSKDDNKDKDGDTSGSSDQKDTMASSMNNHASSGNNSSSDTRTFTTSLYDSPNNTKGIGDSDGPSKRFKEEKNAAQSKSPPISQIKVEGKGNSSSSPPNSGGPDRPRSESITKFQQSRGFAKPPQFNKLNSSSIQNFW
jgi:hypothetical protein